MTNLIIKIPRPCFFSQHPLLMQLVKHRLWNIRIRNNRRLFHDDSTLVTNQIFCHQNFYGILVCLWNSRNDTAIKFFDDGLDTRFPCVKIWRDGKTFREFFANDFIFQVLAKQLQLEGFNLWFPIRKVATELVGFFFTQLFDDFLERRFRIFKSG